jgi:hypothetical protein
MQEKIHVDFVYKRILYRIIERTSFEDKQSDFSLKLK